MKENKDQFAYVGHIKEAIESIEEFLAGVDFQKFSENKMIFNAVVRELEIIGEAANSIDEDFKNQFSDIPWRKMIGMRNTIAHEYFAVNKEIVWKTCQKSLPELKKMMEKVL